MKQVFLLSKQNLELSKQEVLALTKTEYELIDNLLIQETKFKDYKRLAYTKRIYQLLFISYKDTLEQDLENFNWNKIYKENFCLRSIETKLDEANLAGYIWRKLKNPKVNLKNPKTEIHIIKKGSKFLCCLLKYQNKELFEKRKAHLRPALMPISLHPRLARAIVNLTGIKTNETLLDPFCGTAGILIEAGLINIKPIGYDISKKMLEKAELNLKYYKIKDYHLEQQDALKIKTKFPYIIADLPYGLNTKKSDLKELYLDFLKTLEKILTKKAVIIFPDFINYKSLITKTNLNIEHEFDYFIHKSLTKKIVLISQ